MRLKEKSGDTEGEREKNLNMKREWERKEERIILGEGEERIIKVLPYEKQTTRNHHTNYE